MEPSKDQQLVEVRAGHQLLPFQAGLVAFLVEPGASLEEPEASLEGPEASLVEQVALPLEAFLEEGPAYLVGQAAFLEEGSAYQEVPEGHP